MKTLKLLISLSVLFGSSLAHADLYSDLSDLKKICDAKLLDETECKHKRQHILAKYDGAEGEWFCNYSGNPTKPQAFSQTDSKGYAESTSTSAIVKEILDTAGLAPNFVVRPASVPNAAASARGGQRFIEYNPAFVSQLKEGAKSNWSIYSVMAHEIGHHLQGHTIQAGGSRPDIELEADEYSGFILAKLGAKLGEAQIAMTTFGSDSSSGTHPKTDARLKAIKTGWDRGTASSATNSKSTSTLSMPNEAITNNPAPQAIPPQASAKYTDSCVVNGEQVLISSTGAILSKVRGFMQVGQKVAPADPQCSFDLVSNNGRYCVATTGLIFFGTPMPVGQCIPCTSNLCN